MVLQPSDLDGPYACMIDDADDSCAHKDVACSSTVHDRSTVDPTHVVTCLCFREIGHAPPLPRPATSSRIPSRSLARVLILTLVISSHI